MLATKTLQAIEKALESDQGAKFRGYLAETILLVKDAYSTDKDEFRSHLGASLIGRECNREIWYSFRWALKKNLSGRILRLFNRGHLEEARFLALLKMIGVTIWQQDNNGNQFRISGYKGHFSGSMDGVVQGIPEIPNEPVLTEFKTHNDKSFAKLKDVGLMNAKWEHFVQMQQYMGSNKFNWGLYLAVNKNDDDVYAELVAFDINNFVKHQNKIIKIIDATEAPKKINESPAWYKCKFCDYKDLCHGNELPNKNCRTCIHSVILNEGKWMCNRDGKILSKDDQLNGCQDWEMIPSIKG